MKCYKILECKNLHKVSTELLDFLGQKKQLQRTDIKFWNFLSKQDLFDLTRNCEQTVKWFDGLGLRVREGSFTIWNEKIKTSPHIDAPPVVAKINVPLLNTKNTYNLWFDRDGKEIDRVECVHPIVLRSDILHTVELAPNAKLPRIQMSFCFYKEPIEYLK